MNFFTALLFSALIASSFSQEEVSFGGRSGRWFYAGNPTQTCNTSPPGLNFCLNGASCNKYGEKYTCLSSGYSKPLPCQEPTPYCTGQPGYARCSATPDAALGCSSGANYICPGEGVFPDLHDCYVYYYCYLNQATGELQAEEQGRCPAGYPFNPADESDSKCLKGACLTPRCSTSNVNEWVPLNYTNSIISNRLALYCSLGQPQSIFQCPPGMTFDVAYSNNPNPMCTVECIEDHKVVPYVNDIRRYYECYGGSPVLMTCPSIRPYFNPVTLKCVTQIVY